MIADPWFYAVAVPAVLLMGISKSGFGAGFGALSTPLVALAVPVPQAAAIMLPLLLVQDVIGLRQLWRERDAVQLRMLLPAGLAGIGLGTLLFGLFDTALVAGVVGVLTLLFLAHRLAAQAPAAGAPAPPLWKGRLLAAAAGFTSFVAHAGSPPLTAWLLPQQLPPLRYAATSAVFFAVINAAKWLPYAALGLFDGRNLVTSLVLLPVAPLGVWLGVRWVRHMSPRLFYRLLLAGMLCTGLKLTWDGLRAVMAGAG